MIRKLVLWCLAFSVLVCCTSGSIRGKDEPPENAPREVHVVGIYEGYKRTGDQIHGDRAVVAVDRPKTRVILVLSAYEPVTWEIKPTAGTLIEKVILGGYERQAVKGLPERTQVDEAYRGAAGADFVRYAYRIDTPEFRGLVHHLDKKLKLPLSSFQGMYAAKQDAPIVINRVQDDPRLSADYPKPAAKEELPELIFWAMQMVPGDRGFEMEASYGDFTLAGPIAETLKPLPRGILQVAFNPVTKKHYASTMHEVGELDLATKAFTKIDMGIDVPKLSWPAGLTVDTKRRRLLVTSRGYFYSCDLATGEWSAVAENREHNLLVCHPKHDAVYSLSYEFGDENRMPVLKEMNSEGAVLKRTKLGDPILPGIAVGPAQIGPQLIAVDQFLVMIVPPPGRHGSEVELPKLTYIYLIDPKAEKVWLAWKG